MKIVDLSLPLYSGMPVYPWDPDVSIERVFTLEQDSWNMCRIEMKNLDERFRVHEREIWWCSMWVNLWDEEDGKNELFERPVLVIRKFNNGLVWWIPMSTKIKENPYYHIIDHDSIQFSLILSQLRVISTKRFQRYIRKMWHDEFNMILEKIHSIIPLPYNKRSPDESELLSGP